MKLIIGLGNPSPSYTGNRHNVGHMIINRILEGKLPKDLVAKKTDVFMNESGRFVKKLTDKYHIKNQDLYIIHDDLDIPLGSYKIQFGKGPKVHNGLNDIYEKLGTHDFWHVRVGVDNRISGTRTKGEDYVLEDFLPEEKLVLDLVTNEICKKLVT